MSPLQDHSTPRPPMEAPVTIVDSPATEPPVSSLVRCGGILFQRSARGWQSDKVPGISPWPLRLAALGHPVEVVRVGPPS